MVSLTLNSADWTTCAVFFIHLTLFYGRRTWRQINVLQEYQFQTLSQAMTVKLSDISALDSPKCKIKDPAKVEHLLNQLACGGVNRLQIVADFDFTITKRQLENGERVLSSFGLLEQCPSLPEVYRQKANELKEKYFPIEINPHMDVSEKIEAMVEWWSRSSELLKGFPLSQNEIESIAEHYKDATRDGAKDLFDQLHKSNVPILIFSAGLGDSVRAMLKYFNMLLPNVKLVSNFLKYKDGLLDGYDTHNMIHVFNKNESALKGSKEYDLLHDRNNIIVMGDSLGDSSMGNGCVSGSEAHILKIGFLNEHVSSTASVMSEQHAKNIV
ncbi:7-methylguanosine phosphate-specific 5'-nucleotidase [Pseudolycoriella hygida]|uniref:5'-nucleotidase n=1 Tax=Pseudolycoriella hygida TaxID=35572 RepID=A0A9Q0NAJ5_9DIPT|nr:7-methylguanosine phosphate-specific 5'-nucleotidase [Pseudolycoriella hygida]